MKRVDVLLHRARRLDGIMRPTISILSYQEGEYRLECGLWDGKDRTKKEVSSHATRQAALDAFDMFLSKFSANRRDASVLLDLTDLMGGGD